MAEALLSLDFGTNGVRAGLFDPASKEMLGKAMGPYPTRYPLPGHAEQDTADWWRALVGILPRLLAEAGHPEVLTVTVATFASTVVAATRAGEVLAPAILWMDARAAEEAAHTGTVDHTLMEDCGGSDAVEWLVPMAMWLARHRPEIWARTEVICEALDYVNFRLTGTWAGSMMNATAKWNYDGRARRFAPELYAAFGIPELGRKLPARMVDIGAAVAPMRAEVATELGIAGTPLVVQGGIDAHMGTFGADTVRPGSMLFIGGTSNVHLTQVPDDGTPVTGVWGPYPNALTPGLRMIEGGQVSAGSILKWLTETVFGCAPDDPALMAAVAGEEPGASGLLALDFWMGCRTPYRDARLRGAMMGFSLSHERPAIYRAAMTSLALGAANVLVDLERQGVGIDHVVLSGGIVSNPLWLAATVDAMGKPVELVREDNLTLRGGAAAGATALGLHEDMAAAAAAWRGPSETLIPDENRHALYAELLGEYREAVEALAPILHRLADRAAARAPQPGRRPAR